VILLFIKMGGGQASIRYFSSLWPLTILLWTLGVNELSEKLCKRFSVIKSEVAVLIMAVLVAVWIVPLNAVIHLQGKTHPYKQIRAAIEKHITPGSYVIFDRWYESGNEMRLYAPSNVRYAVTVFDNHYDDFISNDWRNVTRKVFQKYPRRVAYCEIRKAFFKEVGVWRFPRTHFKYRTAVTNKPGLVLRAWGIAPRECFYAPYTNGLITEIFWNN